MRLLYRTGRGLSIAQLGVSSASSITLGDLANKPQFYGGNTAETVSAANDNGSWNGDRALSLLSSSAWFVLGSTSDNGVISGVFAHGRGVGSVENRMSHRTILLGY